MIEAIKLLTETGEPEKDPGHRPLKKRPKDGSKSQRWETPAELDRIYQWGMESYTVKKPGERWNRIIEHSRRQAINYTYLISFLVLRVSEALSLTIGDNKIGKEPEYSIDPKNPDKIYFGRLKSGTDMPPEVMTVMPNDRFARVVLRDQVNMAIRNNTVHFFHAYNGLPITRQALDKALKKMMTAYHIYTIHQVEIGRRSEPSTYDRWATHDCRRSGAVRFLTHENPQFRLSVIEIQKLLGHNDPRTTYAYLKGITHGIIMRKRLAVNISPDEMSLLDGLDTQLAKLPSR